MFTDINIGVITLSNSHLMMAMIADFIPEYLHEIAVQRDTLWQDYLAKLEEAGEW